MESTDHTQAQAKKHWSDEADSKSCKRNRGDDVFFTRNPLCRNEGDHWVRLPWEQEEETKLDRERKR